MSMGPCLCGDPYCGSCWNPKQMRFEETLCDIFEDCPMCIDLSWLVTYISAKWDKLSNLALIEEYERSREDDHWENCAPYWVDAYDYRDGGKKEEE